MHADCPSSLRRVAPLVVAWCLAGPGGPPPVAQEAPAPARQAGTAVAAVSPDAFEVRPVTIRRGGAVSMKRTPSPT